MMPAALENPAPTVRPDARRATPRPTGKLRLGVIGMGSRLTSLLATVMKFDARFTLDLVVDPDVDGATERARRLGEGAPRPLFLGGVEEISGDSAADIDGFLIGARCHLHAPLAVQLARHGKPLFLEKPVGISAAQLDTLRHAYAGREDRVVVAFPLRVSPLFETVREIVDSGRLGVVNQIQAVNYVPYGGVYFADWYRDAAQTGGLWLQKATHDLDYLGLLAGEQPEWIFATETRLVYGGERPFGLRCSRCGDADICVESPQNLARRGDAGGMGPGDHWCAFSRGIENHDAASAVVGYPSGLHLNYVQNFVTRPPAGRRGATITGHAGTLEFDWRSHSITVTDHHRARVECIEVKSTTSHSGGDMVLWDRFVRLIERDEPASPNLADGIRSAALCLAAKASCEERRPVYLSAQP